MRTTHFIVYLVLILFSANILAHTPLKSSNPSDNTVLKNAPKTLILSFREPVALAKVELLNEKGEKLAISFQPTPQPHADYEIPLTTLATGKYQVHWSALGADTHKITGDLSFTVNPLADEEVTHHDQSSESAHHDHDDHDAHH